MAAPLLEIRNVKKYYPVKKVRNGEDISVKAVDQIDLTVNQGEIVGLVGESGCGKSTLGKTILKLHDITGGQILFHGERTLPIIRKSRCVLCVKRSRSSSRIPMPL